METAGTRCFSDFDAPEEIFSIRFIVTTPEGDVDKIISNSDEKLGGIIIKRNAITSAQKDFILKSTGGLCYICQARLPPKSGWNVEHVVAFSKNKVANDVMGNLLPACGNCNSRKHTKSLERLIQENNFTIDLMTAAATVEHLEDAAKAVIKAALTIKHERKAALAEDYNPAAMANMLLDFNALLKSNNNELTDDEKRVFLKDVMKNTREFFLKVGKNNRPELNQVSVNQNKMLGFGGFGAVYSGRITYSHVSNLDRKKDANVAIKTVFLDVSALRELAFLDRFYHHNILKYHGYYVQEKRIGIVLERCNYSLKDPVFESGEILLSLVNPFKVIYEMSQALKYMHSFNCIHRDVDPSNILLKVAKKSYVTAQSKLCDFGTAKPILKDSSVYNTVNPAHKPNFCCPKALQGIVGSFTDVYSLGKTMEAFYSAKNPALDAKNPALDGNDISLNWLSFMNMMTTECVEERPEMEEVSSKMREMANSVGAPYIWWTIKSPRKRVSEIVSVEYVDCIAMQSLSLKDEDKEIDEVKIKSIEEIEVKENGKSDEAVASSDEKDDEKVKEEVDEVMKSILDVIAEEEDYNSNESEDEDEDEDELPVFLTLTARCRERPNGVKNMSYHSKSGCHGAKISVDLTDAMMSSHEPCQKCCR